MTFIAKVETALEEIEGRGMLEAYAAHAAAKMLADSWRDAIRDGSDPSKLVADVDHTIAELNFFKTLILKA